MRQRQQGMTLIGMLCILALVGVILYAGIRLSTVYRSLERHWQIEAIDHVEDKDVEIVKDEGSVSMHVEYDDSVPYIANVSLAVHFDKTVKVQ